MSGAARRRLAALGPPASTAPVALAVLALALAALLPRVGTERPVPRYQVTFDVSQSMDVADVALDGAPVTRLELARGAARALLAELPCGAALGWSAFVGGRTTVLVAPLEVCAHYEALLSSLDAVDGRLRWANASSVGKGLHQSLRAAAELGGATRAVMFTDGHEAPPLGQNQSGLPKGLPEGIGGALVGVGGEVPVPVPRSDEEGRAVGWWTAEDVVQRPGPAGRPSREELSALDAEHLGALAALAGLDYLRLRRPEDVARALAGARGLERREVPTDLSWIPALVALAGLAWRFAPRAARPPR